MYVRPGIRTFDCGAPAIAAEMPITSTFEKAKPVEHLESGAEGTGKGATHLDQTHEYLIALNGDHPIVQMSRAATDNVMNAPAQCDGQFRIMIGTARSVAIERTAVPLRPFSA